MINKNLTFVRYKDEMPEGQDVKEGVRQKTK
jgi:hypothetical protein